MSRERLNLILLDQNGKFIDEKEIFIYEDQTASVNIFQEGIEEDYKITDKKEDE